MTPLKKNAALGVRWLTCGWRLFERNPWLFVGMGLCCEVLIGVLALIPLLHGPMIALVAPMLLASAYLTIDSVVRQKLRLPAALRGAFAAGGGVIEPSSLSAITCSYRALSRCKAYAVPRVYELRPIMRHCRPCISPSHAPRPAMRLAQPCASPGHGVVRLSAILPGA